MFPVLEFDILVVGAGIGGMTVATLCAQSGASVAVIETAENVGGSSIMSEGYVWTLPDTESFIADDPDGDVSKFEAMLRELPEVFRWLEDLGINVSDPQPVLKGIGRQIDVVGFFARTQRLVEAKGGMIFTRSKVTELVLDEGAVIGAVVLDDATGERAQIDASATVLATGGFHGNSALREHFGLPSGQSLIPRGNPHNRGGGLELGLSVGAAVSGGMSSFYGHPVPYPLQKLDRRDYTMLVQYQVMQGILLDKSGKRFCDESLSYSYAAQCIASQGTALLIIDERCRREHLLKPFLPGMESGLDKMAEGGARGANYACGSLAEVAAACAAWGYSEGGITESVSEFNRDPAHMRTRYREPLAEAPYSALEVQGSITFTFGGLAADVDGRVLDEKGQPIPGLFAAGVEAGGLSVAGYAGGLVRGLALGRRTARCLLAKGSGNSALKDGARV